MKRISMFCLLIMLSCPLMAQKKKIDSLQKLLELKCADTLRATRLLQISKMEMAADGESSLSHAKEAIAISKKTGDLLKQGMGMVSAGNAWLVGLGNTDSAIACYKRALAFAKQNNIRYIQGAALNNLGNCAKNQNRLDDALEYYEDAAFVREEIKDSLGLSGTVSNMGAVYQQRGDMKKALEYYYRALPYKESHHDLPGMSNTITNIGNAYLDLKQPEQAIEQFRRAEKILIAIENYYTLAQIYNGIGIANYDLGRYDSSFFYYDQARDIRRQLGDSVGLAESYNNIGNLCIIQKKNAEALWYYRMAISTMNSVGPLGKVQYLCNFSSGLLAAGKKDSAELVLKQAEVLVEEAGVPDARLALLGAYVEIYDAAGDYGKALDYLRKRESLYDSVYRNDNLRSLGDLETRYQSRKKEQAVAMAQKENELLEKDRAAQRNLMYAIGGGILLTLLVLLMLIRNNRLRRKANLQLEEQNRIIDEKNKDITDSITYARRIQRSVLPDEKTMWALFGDYFVINRPRDIVSGDFYWATKKGDKVYIAAADCTGHGVPGSLVSMIGVNMLNKIMEQSGAIDPSEILGKLHEQVVNSLQKEVKSSGSVVKDGMDIALVCIDRKQRRLIFSGASRPMYVKTVNEFRVVKGERYSIGGEKKVGEHYQQEEILFERGTTFWLTSDGYADQFGKSTGKKFMTKRFADMLDSLSDRPMKEQAVEIEKAYDEWKGDLEQVDDVLMVGIRL